MDLSHCSDVTSGWCPKVFAVAVVASMAAVAIFSFLTLLITIGKSEDIREDVKVRIKVTQYR